MAPAFEAATALGDGLARAEAAALLRLARTRGESLEAARAAILPGPESDKPMREFRLLVVRFFDEFAEHGVPKSRRPVVGRLGPAKKRRVIAALRAGQSVAEIRRAVGVAPGTIAEVRSQLKSEERQNGNVGIP